jgi:hypothetical protein
MRVAVRLGLLAKKKNLQNVSNTNPGVRKTIPTGSGCIQWKGWCVCVHTHHCGDFRNSLFLYLSRIAGVGKITAAKTAGDG